MVVQSVVCVGGLNEVVDSDLVFVCLVFFVLLPIILSLRLALTHERCGHWNLEGK